MYGLLWRLLPGPTWLKVIELLVLAAACFYGLMEYVFPWADATWNLSGTPDISF